MKIPAVSEPATSDSMDVDENVKSVLEPGQVDNYVDEVSSEYQDFQDDFDYSQIEESERPYARQRASLGRSLMRRSLKDAFSLGQILNDMKGRIPDAFGKWRKLSLGIEDKTAQRFMRLAERLGGDYVNLTAIPVSDLYTLTAENIPDGVIEECINLGRAGELTVDRVRQLIKTARVTDVAFTSNAGSRVHKALPMRLALPRSSANVEDVMSVVHLGGERQFDDPVAAIKAAIARVTDQYRSRLTRAQVDALRVYLDELCAA